MEKRKPREERGTENNRSDHSSLDPFDHYTSAALALVAAGVSKRGAVTVVSIVHDDTCARPRGGPCTCSPRLVVEREADA